MANTLPWDGHSRDEFGRDALGFLDARCPYCSASLFLSDENAGRGESAAICLNGCRLPGYLWQRLHSIPGGLTSLPDGLPAPEQKGASSGG